jgi:hypothetical protein
LKNEDANILENKNISYWKNKLDASGMQVVMPGTIMHLWDLYRICRANILILSDNGQIHPGPTIYDSFWIRDSSVEGIACALCGDEQLSIRQIGHHYTEEFNVNKNEWIGPANAFGFFGGEHEKNDREWDSNGQALWAIGRSDRQMPLVFLAENMKRMTVSGIVMGRHFGPLEDWTGYWVAKKVSGKPCSHLLF